MSKSKKFAALVAILVAFSSVALAQKDYDDEAHGLYIPKERLFYGGVLAGASFSQVDGDFYAGYHKIGLNVGGIAYAQLGKYVAMSMEILYTQRGSRSTYPKRAPVSNNFDIWDYSIKTNYAEIPIMINYFDKRKSHFGMGVAYSRLVNGNEYITIDSGTGPIKIDFGDKYQFRKNNFDLVASAQLHLYKGFFLNVRFQYSLSPIRAGRELPPPDYARANQYANTWTVRLMYLVNN